MEDNTEIKTVIPNSFWIVAIILILVWIFTPGIIWLIVIFGPFDDVNVLSKMGTFGDLFGSINALFSGVALISIVYTILLQKQELSLQRQELTLTRKEFERQGTEFEKQTKLLEEQNREQSKHLKEQLDSIAFQNYTTYYFKLLEGYKEVVEKLEFSNRKGKLSISYLFNTEVEYTYFKLLGIEKDTFGEYRDNIDKEINSREKLHLGNLEKIKIKSFTDNIQYFGSEYYDYIKKINNILLLIKRIPSGNTEIKTFLIDTFLSELTNDELTFLANSAIGFTDEELFKNLFQLLEDLELLKSLKNIKDYTNKTIIEKSFKHLEIINDNMVQENDNSQRI